MGNESQAVSPSGLLIVDKPYRLSSTSITNVVRARLRKGGAPKRVKVGHGGTLDPLASGVLVLLIGKATKLCDRIMRGEKRYVAELDLAHVSTTDDLEGEITEVSLLRAPEREEFEAVLPRFVGTIMQRPPIHSAVWVEGKRAYDMARAGEAFELPARPVEVHAIELLEYEWPRARIDVRCGKGTYIRSLARDLGHAVGGGGMLTGLRRTAVGPFTIERAVSLESLPKVMGQGDLLDPAEFLGDEPGV